MNSKYVLIAGVNGAGKSTLYRSIASLKKMKRVNTDEIVSEFGSWKNPADVVKAGKIAIERISEYFSEGISFNQETTLCGNSIIKNILRAKDSGYEIELHYVGVDSVEIAKERIAYRVAHNGHGIPDSDVERRYVESFIRLKEVMSLCNTIIFYDNTYAFNRFAVYKNAQLFYISDDVPDWFKEHIMQSFQ